VSPLLGTLVDTSALLKTAVGALVAAVGTSVAFAFAILGLIRFAEMRRDDRPIEAGAFAALALVGVAATSGAVVFGLIVMTSK
jgi:hypothetical protein